MENDREYGDGGQEGELERAQEPDDTAPTPGRFGPRLGQHDVVETEGPASFWTEVDGMLTSDFTTDFLPSEGDYRLGALTDAFPTDPPPSDDGLNSTDFPDATGPLTAPQSPSTDPGFRGAHDYDLPAVSADGSRLVGEAEQLPKVEAGDDGRLFPPRADPRPGSTVSEPAPATWPADPPQHGLEPGRPGPAAPLFDPTGEVRLSTQAGGPSPVLPDRSTAADPAMGVAKQQGPVLAEQQQQGHPAGVTPAHPTVNLEPSPHLRYQGSPAPVPVIYETRSILLDVVDRQWLTSGLVAVAAISVGVIGWVVLLGDDGDGASDLVAASTTIADPAGPAAGPTGAAAASAGAGTGSLQRPTTTAALEVAGESEQQSTNQRSTTVVRPRARATAAPTASATTAPPPPPTSSSSSDSTADTTDTSDTTDTTTETTVDPTVTVAGSSTSSSDTTDGGTSSTTDTTTPTTAPSSSTETTPGPTVTSGGSSTETTAGSGSTAPGPTPPAGP